MLLRSWRTGRIVLAVVVLAGMLGVRGTEAASASISLSTATAATGTEITISGSGFGRYQTGLVTFDGRWIKMFRTTIDGHFSVRWTIPAGTTLGSHSVRGWAGRISAATPLTIQKPVTSDGYLRGVNLAGAEFGDSQLPGTFGTDYIYPDASSLDYYRDKGLTLIRLPFRWERVQPTLNGPLSAAETARIEQVLDDAAARDMRVILDVHNYGRYYGAVIGSQAVPATAFANLWQRLATQFRSHPAVWAYGLMNEPHDMNGAWPAAAQAAVDAIRTVDTQHAVLVAGDGWSTARFWRDANEHLSIRDSANNLYYEAHIYFDDDYTGRYDESYDDEAAYPTIGVDRVRPFVEWLQAKGARGFIGEYGVPGDDPRWLTVLDTFMSYLDQNGLGGAYWAGGPWWGDYPLSVEPSGGQDRPQMSVLTKHLSK